MDVDKQIAIKFYGYDLGGRHGMLFMTTGDGKIFIHDGSKQFYTKNYIPFTPSTNAKQAFAVVEIMIDAGWSFTLEFRGFDEDGNQKWWAEFEKNNHCIRGQNCSPTREMAICKAALAAGKDVNKHLQSHKG